MDLKIRVQNVPKTLCRTCLSEKNDLDMQDIFKIADVLKSVTPIKFEKGDGLPSKICLNCLIQAHQAFQFQSLSVKSDSTLRERLISIKQEEEEEEEKEVTMDTNEY